MCLRSILRKNIESNLKVIRYFIFAKRSRVSRIEWKQSSPKDSFRFSILELFSNSNETLNSSSMSEESHTGFGFFLKYSKIVVMNFNTKESVVESKLAARKKRFLKIFSPLDFFSQNGSAAALGKCLPQGINFRFTKSTLNSRWAARILMLSKNWRGILVVPWITPYPRQQRGWWFQ